jgi:hypothetical protein
MNQGAKQLSASALANLKWNMRSKLEYQAIPAVADERFTLFFALSPAG